jgi:RNA polymerase sigma-70 factor (ECF subfamily)
LKIIPLHKNYSKLIEKASNGDRRAQHQLFEMFSPKMLGVCRQYLKNNDLAEEVMLSGFFKMFTHLGDFKNEGSFEGLIKRIAVNTALTALKKRNRIYFERNLEIVETIEFNPEEQEELSLSEILSCMSTLPEGYRTIINLFLVEEFSHKEIAEKLGIAESTSRSQFARARQALMKLLKEKTGRISKKNA